MTRLLLITKSLKVCHTHDMKEKIQRRSFFILEKIQIVSFLMIEKKKIQIGSFFMIENIQMAFLEA